MSGAARVNEPFPGPLAAEYYIDNRNYLPSTRDGRRDVSFGVPGQKEKPRGSVSLHEPRSIHMRRSVTPLLFSITDAASVPHGIRGSRLRLRFCFFFLLIQTRVSPGILRAAFSTYPLAFSMESFMRRNITYELLSIR